MVPQLKAVRNKIKAGAEQLKGIEGYPLVVVLANPRNSSVPLEGPMFISALFGDMQVSFAPVGGVFFHAGRNGRLHVKEPDGSVHGNHPYLSAVAVLRFVYPAATWASAMQQSQEADNEDPLSIVREANQLLARQGEAAAALPHDVFAGPHDTRWGITTPGQYGQLAGAPG